MESALFCRILDCVEKGLHGQLREVQRPFLVVLSGLPGTGKSTLARELGRRLAATVVESDTVRLLLYPHPAFTADESALVFGVCHGVIDRLLVRRVPVIMDATNLQEEHRQAVYAIAERRGVPVHVLLASAPAEVVKERLERRGVGQANAGLPVADWAVYQRMRQVQEPIARPHAVIDTSQPLEPQLERFVAQVQGRGVVTERMA